MARETFKLGIALRAFDKVTGPVQKINRSLESIQGPLRRLNNRFRSLSQAAGLQRLRQSIGRVGGATRRLTSAVAGLLAKFALIGGVAAAGLARIVQTTASAADKLSKLSNASGISVESLQTLGFAMEQSGGSTQQFEKAIVQWNKVLGEAQAGTGMLVTFLNKSNPALLEQLNTVQDSETGFRMLLEAINAAETPMEKMALASAAFGKRTAQAMVVLANQGTEGLKSLEKEMLALGVITEEDAKKAEPFNDAINSMSKSFNFLKSTIVLNALPALKEVVDSITQFFSGRQEQVREFAKEFARELPRRLLRIKELFQQIWRALEPIRRGLQFLIADNDRLKATLAVLGVLIAGKVIVAIYGLATALGALGVTLLTTPVGWFIGIIAGLAAIAFLVVKNWSKVKDFFVNLWESPAGKIIKFLTPIDELASAASFIMDNWRPILNFFDGLFDNLTQIVDDFLDTLGPLKDFFTGKLARGLLKRFVGITDEGSPEIANRELGVRQLSQNITRNETTTKNASVQVDFKNVPRGTRIQSEVEPGLAMTLDRGFAMERF